MYNADKQDRFSYWKRPWQKWFVLIAAILQLLCLWMNIQEYKEISSIPIFSASELASFAASTKWQCAINGVLLGCFSGTFLIGIFAKSQRAARLAEGILLLALFVAWGAAGFVLRPFPPNMRLFWALMLLIAFGGAIYSLWQYRKN